MFECLYLNICVNTLNIKDQTYVSIVLRIFPQRKLGFMKFYLVVNYYLVNLSFEFDEDPWINASARVVNMCAPFFREYGRLRLVCAHLCTNLHDI